MQLLGLPGTEQYPIELQPLQHRWKVVPPQPPQKYSPHRLPAGTRFRRQLVLRRPLKQPAMRK